MFNKVSAKLGEVPQALSSFVSLRIMLDVLVWIDDGHRFLITSFDAFE